MGFFEKLWLSRHPKAKPANKNEEALDRSVEDGDKIQSKDDKGEYESTVTREYFEDWDSLEIDGNPELKETIRQNIIRAEKRNHELYKKCAEELDISVEEFKRRLQRKVEQIVAGSDHFRATREKTLKKVLLEDGRWKSQFEVGASNGSFIPHLRSRVENEMFGLVNDVEFNKEQRPIYTFWSDGPNGENNDEGTIPPPAGVKQYGLVHCKIKREVALRKATIAGQDSLGIGDAYPPTPAAKPHFTSIYFYYSWILEDMVSSRKTNWCDDNYTEGQIHDQLLATDIESIHISKGNGMSDEDIADVTRTVEVYNQQNPDNQIELVIY